MQVAPSHLQRLIREERRNLARSGLSTSRRLEILQASLTAWLLHMDQLGQVVRIPQLRT